MSRVGDMRGPEMGGERPAGGFLAGAAALLGLKNLFGGRPETFPLMPVAAAPSVSRVAQSLRSGDDSALGDPADLADDRSDRDEEIGRLVAHVACARAPGRARRILVVRAPGEASSEGLDCSAFASQLARAFAAEGRTILVAVGEQTGERLGLSELIDGSASFSEAIHREVGSRLHILPAGRGRSAPGRGLDVVLDALSDTYDFVVLAAGDVDLDMRRMSVALAPRVDHVLIGCSGQTGSPDMVAFRDLLKAEGAAEVVAARLGEARGASREAA